MKTRYFFILMILLTTYHNSYAFSLKLINDINLPTHTMFKNTEVGGLSGLSYDPSNDLLWSISDDRGNKGAGEKNSPRIYTWKMHLTSQNKYELSLNDVFFLQMKSDNILPCLSVRK